MSSNVSILLAIAGAGVVAAIMLVRSGSRDILTYMAIYFAFFALGPAVNLLLGNSIYIGTPIAEVGMASMGILLALLGILAVAIALPGQRAAMSRENLDDPTRVYHLAGVLLAGLTAYALGAMVLNGPNLLAGSKTDRIAAVGPWHYQYLGLELLACSLYFLAARTRGSRRLYWTNMACYVVYCLATNERDFIFVFFALLLHLQLFRARTISARLALTGSCFVVLATYLAAVRGGDDWGVEQLLNQGSVMFVDTYVRSVVPDAVSFQHGQTYLDAVANLVPGGLTGPHTTLMTWLVDSYAPGSSSGYGFSLSAEGYMNFGLIGIPVVFAVIALAQRYFVIRAARSQFFAYMSMLFTVSWMYGIRGESATFLKTLAYGALLFGLVRLTSYARRRPDVLAQRLWPFGNFGDARPDLVEGPAEVKG